MPGLTNWLKVICCRFPDVPANGTRDEDPGLKPIEPGGKHITLMYFTKKQYNHLSGNVTLPPIKNNIHV